MHDQARHHQSDGLRPGSRQRRLERKTLSKTPESDGFGIRRLQCYLARRQEEPWRVKPEPVRLVLVLFDI